MHPVKQRSAPSALSLSQGFTLTEVLIVVVLIGVLAAIGYPSYLNYAREAKRSDAHQALTNLAAQQERFFSDNNAYTNNLTNLGYGTNAEASPGGYYQIRVTAVAANSYTLQASACTAAGAPVAGCTSGAQNNDAGCTNIQLTSTGAKTPAICWGN